MDKTDLGKMMGSQLRRIHNLSIGKADNLDYQRNCHQQAVFFRGNYLKHLPKDTQAHILEIGCGMGQFLYFCRSQGYTQSIGIDLDPVNIHFCLEHGLKVHQSDALEFLSKSQQSYDCIIMNDVIEHFPKYIIPQLLQAIYMSLRPGGRFIAKTVNMNNPLLGSSARYVDFSHEFGLTDESMYQILSASGFDRVAVYPSHLYVYYWNPFNYLAWGVSLFFEVFFHAYFRLHGHKSCRIFTKNILAVAERVEESFKTLKEND